MKQISCISLMMLMAHTTYTMDTVRTLLLKTNQPTKQDIRKLIKKQKEDQVKAAIKSIAYDPLSETYKLNQNSGQWIDELREVAKKEDKKCSYNWANSNDADACKKRHIKKFVGAVSLTNGLITSGVGILGLRPPHSIPILGGMVIGLGLVQCFQGSKKLYKGLQGKECLEQRMHRASRIERYLRDLSYNLPKSDK